MGLIEGQVLGKIKKMTKEEKAKKFKPKPYMLLENGYPIGKYESHKKAKAAKHKAIVEAYEDMLDLEYTIVPL